MKRSMGLFCLAFGLAGCQQPQPAANPFMRTAVPPPGTGQAAAPVVVDPYYPPSVPGPTTATPTAPVVVAPAAPPPGAVPPPATGPPGQYKPTPGMVDFFYHQSSAQQEKAVDPHAPGYRAGSTAQMRRSRAAGSSEPAATAERSVLAKSREPTSSAETVAQFTTEPSGPAAARLEALVQDKSAEVTRASFREAADTDAKHGAADSAKVAARIPITATGPLHMTSEATGTGRSGVGNTLRVLGANEPARSTANVVTADAEQEPATTPRMTLTVEDSGETPNPTSQPARVATAAADDGRAAEVRAEADEGVRLAGGMDPFGEPVTGSGKEPAIKQAAATIPARQQQTSSRQPSSATRQPEASPSSGPSFSYAANYEWLRGRLEYSQSAKQWKLRYIPIDGQTDRYGGSVVLPSSPLLEGHKAGEFVSIQGAIGRAPAGSGSFSPLYELRHLEPLAP